MHWLATTEDQTEALGAAFAKAVPRVLTRACVVYLSGALGAGKTTLARGFLRGAGITGTVRSPTYQLMEVYETDTFDIVHLDLYRLEALRDIEALGLRDFEQGGTVWLVEWPEKGAGVLPAPDLHLALAAEQTGHTILATAESVSGQVWMNRLEAVEIPTAWP
jgi:tRNA threonylcarbamoyladenosine biosynthesis protein TsaE